MDISELWVAIQEIQEHISIINGELGKTMTDVMWLKQSFWEMMTWIRIIGCAVIVGVLLSIWHLIIVKKNGYKT